MGDKVHKIASSISTVNSFTPSFFAFPTIGGAGACDFSLFSNSTESTMTVHIQSRLELEPHWVDVKSYTVTTASKSIRDTIEIGSAQRLRAGVKAGNYTSGAVRLVFTQGGYTR